MRRRNSPIQFGLVGFAGMAPGAPMYQKRRRIYRILRFDFAAGEWLTVFSELGYLRMKKLAGEMSDEAIIVEREK